jgi:hypothetical protein
MPGQSVTNQQPANMETSVGVLFSKSRHAHSFHKTPRVQIVITPYSAHSPSVAKVQEPTNRV